MYQAGLVLEGGGMKGVYTSGVLDFFLDKDIEFSNCYGVSAGACNLCSYSCKFSTVDLSSPKLNPIVFASSAISSSV